MANRGPAGLPVDPAAVVQCELNAPDPCGLSIGHAGDPRRERRRNTAGAAPDPAEKLFTIVHVIHLNKSSGHTLHSFMAASSQEQATHPHS